MKIGVEIDVFNEVNLKLTFQHNVVTQQAKYAINHHCSPHVMELQRSDYICIDNKPKLTVLPPDPSKTSNGSTAKVSGQVDLISLCKDVNIKFLKGEQMNQALQKNFIFKSKFKHKIG